MTIQKEVVRNSGPNSCFASLLCSGAKTMCVHQTYKFLNFDKVVQNAE